MNYNKTKHEFLNSTPLNQNLIKYETAIHYSISQSKILILQTSQSNELQHIVNTYRINKIFYFKLNQNQQIVPALLQLTQSFLINNFYYGEICQMIIKEIISNENYNIALISEDDGITSGSILKAIIILMNFDFERQDQKKNEQQKFKTVYNQNQQKQIDDNLSSLKQDLQNQIINNQWISLPFSLQSSSIESNEIIQNNYDQSQVIIQQENQISETSCIQIQQIENKSPDHSEFLQESKLQKENTINQQQQDNNNFHNTKQQEALKQFTQEVQIFEREVQVASLIIQKPSQLIQKPEKISNNQNQMEEQKKKQEENIQELYPLPKQLIFKQFLKEEAFKCLKKYHQ